MDPSDGKKGRPCLECGQKEAGPFFCSACGGLLEGGNPLDHFALFGLDRSLNLDPLELERRYYQLSAALHPDRHATKDVRLREASEIHAACLNQAYRVLKDPLERARYLVGLEGIQMQDGEIPVELAEDYFELQESAGQAGADIQALLDTVQSKRNGLLNEFQGLCGEWRPGAREVLVRVAKNLTARKYLESMLADIERRGCPF